MTKLSDIYFPYIKKIKNHLIRNEAPYIHLLTVVYKNDLEQLVCLNDEEYSTFWSYYRKLL